jgi:hypothetical protein
MSFSEPSIYRPSNLTEKQKREQLAICYGVEMNPKELTAQEAEQLRTLLARYDGQRKPITVTNLNDPPKTPYHFQKFPMMVYDHEASFPAHDETRTAIVGSSVLEETYHVRAHVASRVVHTEAQLKEALAEGWRETPPPFRELPPETLSDAALAEADQLNAIAKQPRRQRG